MFYERETYLSVDDGEPAQDAGQLVRGAQDGALDPQAGELVLLLRGARRTLERSRVHELGHLVHLREVKN